MNNFESWKRIINFEQLNNIIRVLNREYNIKKIYPERNNVLKAFKLCSYNNLKAIFLLQDPYPQPGIATGIALGNKKDIPEDKISPSLQIIKNSLIRTDVSDCNKKFDITLENWANQGILLINSALTVEANKIGSHVMLWRPFISSLLKNLSEWNPGLIYVLFGNQAQSFLPYIGKNNYIFNCYHPAYYARQDNSFKYDIFDKINDILYDNNREKINWLI